MVFLIILQVFWLILPAGFANFAPVLVAKIFPQWNFPLDGKHTFRQARIFGDHKTLRGLIAGLFFAASIFKFQQFLFETYPFFQNLSLIDYLHQPWYLGAWMGLGALTGDLVKSFFKRQFHIRPGTAWLPFDQIDWILGALLFLRLFVDFSFTHFMVALGLGVILHLLGKWMGYGLGLDEKAI